MHLTGTFCIYFANKLNAECPHFRGTANGRIQVILALTSWVLLVIFIALYGMQLGGNAA